MANKVIQMSDGVDNLYPTMPYVYTDDLTVSGTHLNFNCIVRAATNSTGAPTTDEYLGINLYIGSGFWTQIMTGLSGKTYVRTTNNQTWQEIDNGYSTASLTVPSGATASVANVKKVGRIVTITLVCSGYTLTKNQWSNIATVPSGYRPSNSFDVMAVDTTNALGVECRITAGGEVNVWVRSDAPLPTSIRLCATYIINS